VVPTWEVYGVVKVLIAHMNYLQIVVLECCGAFLELSVAGLTVPISRLVERIQLGCWLEGFGGL